MIGAGSGKYDDEAESLRLKLGADGILLGVIKQNDDGSGFSVQASTEVLHIMPKALRKIADALEKDIAKVNRIQSSWPDSSRS